MHKFLGATALALILLGGFADDASAQTWRSRYSTYYGPGTTQYQFVPPASSYYHPMAAPYRLVPPSTYYYSSTPGYRIYSRGYSTYLSPGDWGYPYAVPAPVSPSPYSYQGSYSSPRTGYQP